MKTPKRRFQFFTMIEMVVVIVIIALLASIATPLYFRHVKKARIGTAKTQIRLLEQAIFDFRLDMGKLPDGNNSLKDLAENTSGDEKWDGPYLKQGLPKDPWGNDYVYKKPGEHGEFDLISYGADGQPGGSGEDADIGNWNSN
jgi:general secretion pathway protein G